MACKKVTVISPKSIMCENILHAKTYYMPKHIICKNILSAKTSYMQKPIIWKKILYANAQLIPSRDIVTIETGTRHRTAERTAKQTGELVISISQRRNIITIFKENERYILEDTEVVLNKANQAIKTLEKYKKAFDSKLNILNEYEFNDIVTLDNAIGVVQRAEMVMQIVMEI